MIMTFSKRRVMLYNILSQIFIVISQSHKVNCRSTVVFFIIFNIKGSKYAHLAFFFS